MLGRAFCSSTLGRKISYQLLRFRVNDTHVPIVSHIYPEQTGQTISFEQAATFLLDFLGCELDKSWKRRTLYLTGLIRLRETLPTEEVRDDYGKKEFSYDGSA